LKETQIVELDDRVVEKLKGTDYVWIDMRVTIPEVHLALRTQHADLIIELYFEKMVLYAKKGLDFLDSGFYLTKTYVIDHITKSELFPNLMETYIPTEQNLIIHKMSSVAGKKIDKYALYIKFESNPRFEKTPLKVTVNSDSKLYLFFNAKCINELKDMFGKAFSNELDLVNFYKEAAKSTAFQYIYKGSEYMSKVDEEVESGKVTRTAIMVDCKMNAPTLVA